MQEYVVLIALQYIIEGEHVVSILCFCTVVGIEQLYHAYYSAFIQGRFLRLSNMVASPLVLGNLVPGH